MYQIYYDSQVKDAYQGYMELKKAVRVKNNVVGDTVKFPVFGKGVAQKRGALSSDVPVMNVDQKYATAKLEPYVAADYTDIFSQKNVNYDEITSQAHVNGAAIGRRCDQQIIDAMDQDGLAAEVDTDEGGAGTNMNFAKIKKAQALLNRRNVPKENRYAVIHANGLSSMLDQPELTSSDFSTIQAIQNGDLKGSWMGFNWIVLGDRDEGGLPLNGALRRNFFFHGGQMGSVGLGINLKSSNIEWIAQKKSWLVSDDYQGGSTAIDPDGIVIVETTDEGAAA